MFTAVPVCADRCQSLLQLLLRLSCVDDIVPQVWAHIAALEHYVASAVAPLVVV